MRVARGHAGELAATFDLLRGAVVAHLRPLANSDPTTRARGTIASVLACFILFCALGSGFAKTTENDGYTEHLHPLLAVSHSVIVVGAIVAVGGRIRAQPQHVDYR